MKKLVIVLVIIVAMFGSCSGISMNDFLKSEHDNTYHDGEKCPYGYVDCPYWEY